MKKSIPLKILEFIQPIVDQNLSIIHQIKDENSMFYLIDNDNQSDFFFRVTKQENRNGHLHYLTEFKPLSRENVQAQGEWIQLDKVGIRVKEWLEIINSYNKIKTVYDDPILKSYEEKFLNDIDIIDNDSNVAPFDLNQQLYLDEYLSTVDEKLEKLKLNRSEEEINQLIQLQYEAKEIKKVISKLTKRDLVKRLAKFWAKSQKIGIDVIKEIFVSVTAELTKQLLVG